MKYYAIETYTPYVGEVNYYYLSVEEDKKLEDYIDLISEWVADNALGWYDDVAEEDYPDWDDYLGECGWCSEEISYEDYISEII